MRRRGGGRRRGPEAVRSCAPQGLVDHRPRDPAGVVRWGVHERPGNSAIRQHGDLLHQYTDRGRTSALAADQFATRRITSYVGLLSSDVVAQRVVADTGIDLSVGQVSSGDRRRCGLEYRLVDRDRHRFRAGAVAHHRSCDCTSFGAIVNQVDPIGPDNVVLRVISGPTLNPVPVSPRTTLNLAVGIVVGLAAGIGIALLRQLLDTTIRQTQLLRTLTDAPVLGVIPFDKSARKSPLIAVSQTRSNRAEALRQLRTNLQFVDVERPVRVLVVTSSVADEGKSTTATNLAVSFAESSRHVLLIEADLRRPRVADYLGLERSVGLTNVLAGQVDVGDALQPWGRGGLVVLPSGSIPPNPSELLGSPRMLDLLEQLKKRFEIIVIDTPPLLPVTDAAVAAAHADGAVLVVRYAKTTRGQIAAAVRSLKSVDARLLGSILNMTPLKGSDGYESYGYGYYETDSAKSADVLAVENASNQAALPARDPGPSNGQAPRSGRTAELDEQPSTGPRGSEERRPIRMRPGASG